MVTVLTAGKIDQRRVHRRLTRAGYATAAEVGNVRISRHGRWDAVDTTAASIVDLPNDALDFARQLLGLAPRSGITCWFDGDPGQSDAWGTVVDIARAVAAEVPLAVLYDHAGTTYLVHPGRGLIGPDETTLARRASTTTDVLRQMFRGR